MHMPCDKQTEKLSWHATRIFKVEKPGIQDFFAIINCLQLASFESIQHFIVCIIRDFTTFLSLSASNACMLSYCV